MDAYTDTPRTYSAARAIARSLLVALLLVVLLAPAAALAHPPGITERVSLSSLGVEGNSISERSALSADGRFVAFVSLADNLVPGDTNGVADVFVRDRLTGATERVSVDSRGRQANGDSSFLGMVQRPAISADGRFVAFASSASNLVPKDTNGVADIFVHDRLTGTTERVSIASNGSQANGESFTPAISGDGRFVAFASGADNLVARDTNFRSDVFVHDRQTGATERVSIASDGSEGDGDSDWPAITPDGRFVAFESAAANLVAGDNDSALDIFLRDRQSGTTEGISLIPAGSSGILNHSSKPAITPDGRFVAFDSLESNLVPSDTNNRADVFVRDRQTGTIERVSVASDGTQGDSDSGAPALSADGRFVAFHSDADNLVSGDTNFDLDVFVHDRQIGSTVRDSVSTSGMETGFELGNLFPAISADGQVIAFHSEGVLVPEDTNTTNDVYVHDERTPADLSVTKSDSPDPVRKGSDLTYSLVVTNNGSGQAIAVRLTDSLPASVTLISVAPTAGSCTAANGTITCDLGTLGNGANATVTIVVTPKKVGTITNSAEVNSLSPDSNQANNTATADTTVTLH